MAKALSTRDQAAQHRRDKFCLEYAFNGGNATQAYIDAGFSKRGAKQSAYRLLTHADLRDRIRMYRDAAFEVAVASKMEIVREASILAVFDPKNMFDEDGNILALHQMDEATRKSINEIEIMLGDEGMKTLKVKYGKDKRGYVDMMMKFYNAYEDHQQSKSMRPIKVFMMYPEDARA